MITSKDWDRLRTVMSQAREQMSADVSRERVEQMLLFTMRQLEEAATLLEKSQQTIEWLSVGLHLTCLTALACNDLPADLRNKVLVMCGANTVLAENMEIDLPVPPPRGGD